MTAATAAVAPGPTAQIISRDCIKLHATALGPFIRDQTFAWSARSFWLSIKGPPVRLSHVKEIDTIKNIQMTLATLFHPRRFYTKFRLSCGS